MAHDMTQRAAIGFAVRLAPGSLCGAVTCILHAIPTGTVVQSRTEARLKNQVLTGLNVFD